MSVPARPGRCLFAPVKVTELTEVKCYHCGDACREEHRVHDGHDFCCQGCEVVYDLLNESGLCDYYAYSEQPGVKKQSTVDEPRTELFDLPDVRARIVEFDEGGILRVRFHVPQMHCSSCIWLLENLQRLDGGIIRSRVSFATKELSVTFREERLGLGALVKLLRRLGYGPQLTAAATGGGNNAFRAWCMCAWAWPPSFSATPCSSASRNTWGPMARRG